MSIAVAPAPVSPARPAHHRSLMPREHGAYGQLFFPLLTALALGHGRPAAIGLAIAATALFFAHEPLLVLLGHRGARAKKESGDLAQRRIAQLGFLAFTSGLTGLALAPVAAWIALLVPVTFAALLAPLVVSKREKTTLGECLAATSLATLALPVALAGNVPLASALGSTTVWCLALLTATLSVRALIARGRERPFARLQTAATTVSMLPLAVGLALAHDGVLPHGVPFSLLPMAVVCLELALLAPPNRYLREMGWALIATSAVTLGAVVAVFY